MPWWSVPRDWVGQTAFIIAGGPSVAAQNLELLRDRKVLVTNSSYERVPWAEYLVFADSHWWGVHQHRLGEFKGSIITALRTAAPHGDPRVLSLRNSAPFSSRRQAGARFLLSEDPRTVPRCWTVLTAAINVAVHLGANPIVLIGADGKFGPNGERNHHSPHPWAHRNGCWNDHAKDLRALVSPLKARGINVFNTSPGSAWDMWPIVRLEDVV